MSEQERETLIEYPCDFPIKAMGESSEGFDALVVSIVRQHAEDIHEGAVATKQSSGGKYTSVTVTIRATSQNQVDAIYRDLSSHELVKYIL